MNRQAITWALSFAGLALAVAAVATHNRIVTWIATIVLAAAFLLRRVLNRRARHEADEPPAA